MFSNIGKKISKKWLYRCSAAAAAAAAAAADSVLVETLSRVNQVTFEP